MRERPILFSAPMVRAILDDRKGQTRRVVKLPEGITEGPWYWAPPSGRSEPGYADPGVQYWTKRGNHIDPCPYGQPGDRLWVRETWALEALGGGSDGNGSGFSDYEVRFRAGGDPVEHSYEGPFGQDPYAKYFDRRRGDWTPSIHMPRWASRLTLEVTGVRVERLQDITEEDAKAEGVEGEHFSDRDDLGLNVEGWSFRDYRDPTGIDQLTSAKQSFWTLWESINGAGSWDANPWVWVVEFRRAA